MKRIIKCMLALLMIAPVTSCKAIKEKKAAEQYEEECKDILTNAKEYVYQLYKGKSANKSVRIDSGDYSLLSQTKVGDKTVAISWKVEKDASAKEVAVIENGEDGSVTCKVTYNFETNDKEYAYKLVGTFTYENHTDTLTINCTVPQFKIYTIAELLKLKSGTSDVNVAGYVVATNSTAAKTGDFVISDGTGVVYCYTYLKNVLLGDYITLNCTFKIYSNLNELDKAVILGQTPATGAALPHAEAKVLDMETLSPVGSYMNESVLAYESFYCSVTGTLVKDGKYYYLQDSKGQASVSLYLNASITNADSLVGKTVTAKGYIGGSSKNKTTNIGYLKFMTNEISE